MPADIICLELDCLTGERIIFQRSQVTGALVDVSIVQSQATVRVQVKPEALLLVIKFINLETK